jgi:hypothetical protein
VHVLATAYVTGVKDVEVLEGAEEVRADFRLEKGGTITGRVVTEGSARPIQGARVSVEGVAAGAALTPSFHAVTDEQGRFSMDGIPSSGVSLFVAAPGHNAKIVQQVRPGSHEIALSEAEDAGPRVELVGIGAVLKAREDALVVGEVFPGSGAADAGLQPGDELITLDGKPVVDVGWPAAVNVIRGEPGTQLVLGVRKQGKPPVKIVTVIRKRVGA